MYHAVRMRLCRDLGGMYLQQLRHGSDAEAGPDATVTEESVGERGYLALDSHHRRRREAADTDDERGDDGGPCPRERRHRRRA